MGSLLRWLCQTQTRSPSDCKPAEHIMEVSINGGTPKERIVYKGKSHLEMDDEWGYPYLWKPPYATHVWKIYQDLQYPRNT